MVQGSARKPLCGAECIYIQPLSERAALFYHIGMKNAVKY
jgi:hypothetical protein